MNTNAQLVAHPVTNRVAALAPTTRRTRVAAIAITGVLLAITSGALTMTALHAADHAPKSATVVNVQLPTE